MAERTHVADMIAMHQRVVVKPGHPCYCGEWPSVPVDEAGRRVGEVGWHEHVAAALAEAGLIRDRSTAAIAAAAWDEAVQGMAWALVNGPDDAALIYVRDHNPYRTTPPGPALATAEPGGPDPQPSTGGES